jgi:tRNA-(ms[2]io[6]A)-hydroxylase
MTTDPISRINSFLSCQTPEPWVQSALENQDLLLIDHANCEKKAAATAMNLMYRYVDRTELLQKMSQLAREELLHFEQVIKIMQNKQVLYSHLGPSRYASGLREHVRTHEPAKLIDTLIVGAFVEARSCERFAKLAPSLDDELKKFYLSLLRSEGRHFEDYLALAELYADEDISDRVAFFAEKEAELINNPDDEFRFHSGMPASASH